MDETDADRIRRTWSVAASDPATTARAFYSNLFALAPQVQTLFKSDMEAQGAKLMETLGFVVDHLEDDDSLLPAARDLAIRHVAYGVQPADYASVGQALILTFETALGPQFSAEDRAAWVGAYTGLSDYMIAEVG